jgi:hypothetical protein
VSKKEPITLEKAFYESAVSDIREEGWATVGCDMPGVKRRLENWLHSEGQDYSVTERNGEWCFELEYLNAYSVNKTVMNFKNITYLEVLYWSEDYEHPHIQFNLADEIEVKPVMWGDEYVKFYIKLLHEGEVIASFTDYLESYKTLLEITKHESYDEGSGSSLEFRSTFIYFA